MYPLRKYIELARRDTSLRILLSGGEGKGIPVYRLLNKYEINFAQVYSLKMIWIHQ